MLLLEFYEILYTIEQGRCLQKIHATDHGSMKISVQLRTREKSDVIKNMTNHGEDLIHLAVD